jgi:hypothetical protein
MSQISSTSGEVATKVMHLPLSLQSKDKTFTTGLQLSDLDPKTSEKVKNQFKLENFLLFSCETRSVLSVYFNARIKLL